MGEVGGSFNERKNEITRKLGMYPTKPPNSVVKKEDVLLHHHTSYTLNTMSFNSPKRSSDNSENTN